MQFVLDKYLSDIERYLRSLPPNVRQGEIDEMASHLQQLRADFVSQGHSSEEAEALAIGRFGPARKAGLRLRDVWEGNRGVLACFAAVALSNWVLIIANWLAGLVAILALTVGYRALVEPLGPLLIFWVWWTVLLMPSGLNFALGRWGGRRVALAVPAALLPLLAFHSSFAGFSMEMAGFKLSFPYFVLAITLAASAGAWSGSVTKRRSRFAVVGGVPLEEASARLLDVRRGHRRRLLLRTCTCTLSLGLVGAITFAIFKPRVDDVLRPPTPEAAVRVMLSNTGIDPFEAEPATNISTRLLPATPSELKRNERRVFYTATMHASESFRKRRVDYLQKLMAKLEQNLGANPTARQREIYNYEVKSYRASLERMKPEGYTLSRVVCVRKTAQGWKIVEGRNANERPWAWMYDMYYHGPKAAPKP